MRFSLRVLENVIGQRVTLLAIVGEVVEEPGNARLGDGGVGRADVHDGHFQFQRGAQQDMAVLPVNASHHAPAILIEEHFDEFGGRSSPQGRFIVEFERVGLAMISAAGVGLLEGQLRAVEGGNAENHLGIVLQRGEETDGDFAQVERDRRPGAGRPRRCIARVSSRTNQS